MDEAFAACLDIARDMRAEADRQRLYHKAVGPRRSNIEACLAGCKMAWIGEAARRMEAARDRMRATRPAGAEREGSRDG